MEFEGTGRIVHCQRDRAPWWWIWAEGDSMRGLLFIYIINKTKLHFTASLLHLSTGSCLSLLRTHHQHYFASS